MEDMNRRKCLAVITAAPAFAGLGGCARETDQVEKQSPSLLAEEVVVAPSPAPRLSEAELQQIHFDVMTGEPGSVPQSDSFTYQDREFDTSLRNHIRSERILPAIASGELRAVQIPDSASPDYAHIEGLQSDRTFELTHEVMENIFSANSFDHSLTEGLSSYSPNQARVIFGLRGCAIADRRQLARPLESVALKEAQVDHLTMRCILGVWDRENKTVSAHEGSTSPHLSYMQIYRAYLHLKGLIVVNDAAITPEDKIKEEDKLKWRSNWRTNQLASGLHLVTFGAHAGRKSLLTQHTSWYGPVLRASNELSYRLGDWDQSSGRVADNIHPAWAFDGVSFASAGCTCIHGGGGKWPYWGQISRFLLELSSPAQPSGTYAYMIVTGREARLHAENPGAQNLRRLRFGSSGPDVLAVQESGNLLQSIPSNGLFDRSMHYAITEMQQFNGDPTDGVLAIGDA